MCSSFTFSKGLHSIILSVLQLHVIDTHAIPYVCLVLFQLYFVATLDIYMIIKLVCCLKAIWQWFALSHRNETLTGLFFSLGTYGVCGCAFVFWWQRVTIDSHSSTLCLCVSGSGWLKEYSVCARMHAQGCVDETVLCFVPPIFPQKSACGDHHVVCVCVCDCMRASTQEECQLLSRAQWRRRGICWPSATVQLAAIWRLIATPPTTSWPPSKNRYCVYFLLGLC